MAPSRDNVYEGKLTDGFPGKVTVNGEPLDERLDLFNHSPTGFAWCYCGSGPSQLALAILAHEIGDKTAIDVYHAFKERVIAKFDSHAAWRLTGAEVRATVDEILAERAAAATPSDP